MPEKLSKGHVKVNLSTGLIMLQNGAAARQFLTNSWIDVFAERIEASNKQ